MSDCAMLVTEAIEKIKIRIMSLGLNNNPIIIVWSLPPVWWIAERLWDKTLPKFQIENYKEAVGSITKWGIYIQSL